MRQDFWFKTRGFVYTEHRVKRVLYKLHIIIYRKLCKGQRVLMKYKKNVHKRNDKLKIVVYGSLTYMKTDMSSAL